MLWLVVSWVQHQRFYAGSGMQNHKSFPCLPFKSLETTHPLIIE